MWCHDNMVCLIAPQEFLNPSPCSIQETISTFDAFITLAKNLPYGIEIFVIFMLRVCQSRKMLLSIKLVQFNHRGIWVISFESENPFRAGASYYIVMKD